MAPALSMSCKASTFSSRFFLKLIFFNPLSSIIRRSISLSLFSVRSISSTSAPTSIWETRARRGAGQCVRDEGRAAKPQTGPRGVGRRVEIARGNVRPERGSSPCRGSGAGSRTGPAPLPDSCCREEGRGGRGRGSLSRPSVDTPLAVLSEVRGLNLGRELSVGGTKSAI